MAQHDFRIENNPGRGVRTDFNAALAALVSNNSGATEPPSPYPGMLWLDLSVLPNGLMRQRNQANTGWVNMSGVPVEADSSDTVDGTSDSMFVTPAGLNERIDHQTPIVLNRLVNGAMQISQENGSTAVANTTGAAIYGTDQWIGHGVSGTNVTVSQVASITPRKSPNRIRLVATAAKVALAATDTANLYQNIEGVRVADLGFGTAKAKQIIARFGFRGPAGTYTFCLRPSTARAYLHPFVISAANANKDIEVVVVIPGDVAGTWAKDNTMGMQFVVNVACGGTYANATIDTWIAGNWLGAAGGSNGLAVAGNTFELFDAGLYEDVSGMGTPPRWQYPDITEALLLCQRYFYESTLIWSGSPGNGLVYYQVLPFPVDMRILAPTISGVNLGALGFPATNTVLALGTAAGNRSIRENRTCNAASNAGYFVTDITANARM